MAACRPVPKSLVKTWQKLTGWGGVKAPNAAAIFVFTSILTQKTKMLG
jgi:hypothetical protein